MRVLQLIDSLRPGGAEKMAVNIANALLPHVEGSFLCCTRREGFLKQELKPEVGYIFLNKKNSLDWEAIIKLKNFITCNGINIVHAHSTSFFLAGLLKLMGVKFKFIWHDHYGDSEYLEKRKCHLLKYFSRLFDVIISVNTELQKWAVENLGCKKVVEIKNFIPESTGSNLPKVKIRGKEADFKIICVANLRPQKDHLNLLKAFEMIDQDIEVSLHLIGEDPGTVYSASVLTEIKNSPVNHKLFYYGTQKAVLSLLKQSDLGILSSRSEGLPIALLEYGMSGLPVICTDVGKCKETIKSSGKLVQKENPKELAEGILFYMKHKKKRMADAKSFQQEVKEKYSEKGVITRVIKIYRNC